MPRRVVSATRNHHSSLELGDPELGTSTWGTEYECEFHGLREAAADSQDDARHRSAGAASWSGRRSLRTPRSLKQGFVHEQDYAKLEGRYGHAVDAHNELALQLATVEQRLKLLHTKEAEFVTSVDLEHQAVAGVRDQLSGLTESLGRLLANVEKNRAFMALLNNLQEMPMPATPASKIVQDTEVGKRMAGLESRVVELTEAVGALAAEQRKVVAAASKRPPSAAISKAATRRERYERLPPPSASGHADFWKP